MGARLSQVSGNPESKNVPTFAIGIGKQVAIRKPSFETLELPKSYEIWNSSNHQHDRVKSVFDQRVKSQASEINLKLKQNDEALHQIQMKRIVAEQTNSYADKSRLSASTIIPYVQLNSLYDRCKNATSWTDKIFPTKPKRPELTKLIKEHIIKVSRPQPSNELLIELDGVQILRKDIQTLLGTNWLNDEIINAYMYLLVCRGNQNGRKVHAFNTFFYPKLRDSGYSSIKRWTRKVDIFRHDFILVPVHLGNHWCLAVIDLNVKKISYYDSLGGSAGPCCNLLLNYLKDEMADKKKDQCFEKENWCLAEFKGGSPGVPRQENGSDCGVFTCIYAEYITRQAKLDFSQRDMPYFRQKMIYEITKGAILE